MVGRGSYKRGWQPAAPNAHAVTCWLLTVLHLLLTPSAAMPLAWGRMVPTLTSRTLGRLGLLDLSSPVHNYLAFWACLYISIAFSFWLCESSIRAARAAAAAGASGAKGNGTAVKIAGAKHD